MGVELTAGSVCFVPTGGIGRCGRLYAEAAPTFAVFSPLGDSLLVVAGAPEAAVVYVFDPATGSARTLEPEGIRDFNTSAVPRGWSLSSAVWNVDGSAVLLVPRTTAETGPVLEFDLGTGVVTERVQLAAALANSSPSLWTTQTGLAVVANAGAEVNAVWWADFSTGKVSRISSFPDPGGSLSLSAATPAGQTVLVCPRTADGRLGATIGVRVDGSQSAKILSDSLSCAGTVFSSDGSSLAMTAEVDGSYQLIVLDLVSGERLLTTPLPEASPVTPPYLTWLDDVVVATDVTGDWSVPSLVVHVEH
ncbi:MAG: hypothetical protein ABWZ98_11250 [Nakamurella sp.]